MTHGLHPGIFDESDFRVEKKHLATEVGSGMVSVFSTAMMIAGMEETAVKTVQPYLEAGQTTVGVHVDVKHKASTPEGMMVRFVARLLEISAHGNGLLFAVEAYDETGLIGFGTHQRVIVDKDKFEEQAAAKIKNS